MIFQRDKSLCMGFFFAKPTDTTFRLVEYAFSICGVCDQKAMISSFHHFKITPQLLPPPLYQSGGFFFSKAQYSWQIPQGIYMFHNNYIRGRICKEYRLLELDMGMFDSKQMDQPYLTSVSLPADPDVLEEKLKVFAHFSNLLNRTFIVPPVDCSRRGKHYYCTIANRKKYACYSEILVTFHHGFRESVYSFLK